MKYQPTIVLETYVNQHLPVVQILHRFSPVNIQTLNMFLAALTSRSCITPQPGQVHVLTLSGISAIRYPQLEHVIDMVSRRSVRTRRLLYLTKVHDSFVTNSANPRPQIFLPHTYCINFMFRSSRQIVSYSETSLCASFRWNSSLWEAIRRCRHTSAIRAFLLPLPPFSFLVCLQFSPTQPVKAVQQHKV